MSLRVTNLLATQNFIGQMSQSRAELEKLRDKVASGVEVGRPSDEPGKAAAIAQLQSTLTRLEKHQERISYSTSLLSAQDGALESAEAVMLRVRELGTQLASETIGATQRAQAAEEIFSLRDQLVSLANTQYLDVFIYGGTDDDDAPYQQLPQPPAPIAAGYSGPGYLAPVTGSASLRYGWDQEAGTATTRDVRITDSEQLRINSSGQLWAQPIAALERMGRALAGYRTEPTLPYGAPGTGALPDGNGAAYAGPTALAEQTNDILRALDEVEFGRKALNEERLSVGARLNRLSSADQILSSLVQRTTEARSNLQDADPFETASKLADLQTSFQALLASGSRINDLSLLNFL